MKQVVLPLAVLVLLVAGLVDADVVRLKNGGTLEGTTRPGARPGTIEVRKGDGAVVVVPEADIAAIEKKQSPLEELQERLNGVPEGEIDPLIEVLVWAREKRLGTGVKAVAKKILAIDPNHELAREELGYVVFQNRWLLKSELKKKEGLVLHGNEWVTRAERERRLREEMRREFADNLKAAGSDNPYVQDYAIRKVLAARDPAVRDLVGESLLHPEEKVRLLALGILAKFPVKEGEGDAAAAGLAAALHRMVLEEKSDKVLQLAYLTLARFHPAESFRLALQEATTSPAEGGRQRAAEALYHTLRKAFVPDLCRSVVASDGTPRPEVAGVLRRVFKDLKADFGYDAAAWLRFWIENSSRFYDER